MCEDDGETIEKEVCSYQYSQQSHTVPITLLQNSWETLSEKFGVTNCKHVKGQKYGYEPEEICEINYVSQVYVITKIRQK